MALHQFISRKFAHKVVVVGGGLAGMSAALEALGAGAKVILVDKETALGGNSAKASSGQLIEPKFPKFSVKISVKIGKFGNF